MSYTNLGGQQVLKTVFDDPSDSLKVTVVNSTPVEVIIDDSTPISVEVDNVTPIDVTVVGSLPVSVTVPGLDKVEQPNFIVGTTINSSVGAWVTVIAATTADIKRVQLYDTTGRFLNLALGAPASEVVECTLGPGNDSSIDVDIPSGSRISIRSAEAAPVAGNVAINWLG